jgi:predicted phosphodiesterase
MAIFDEVTEAQIGKITATPPAFLIIHISDLHIGREWYPAPALLRGAFAHDPGLCAELQTEVVALISRRAARAALVVVSGDLTTLGSHSEFVMALTFLRSRIQESWHLGVGLGPYEIQVLAVPGNHDHAQDTSWSHLAQRADPSVYTSFLPLGKEWLKTFRDGGLCLEILGIDSCGSKNLQVFAQGGIDPGSLTKLTNELRVAASIPAQARLRLLICHHSPGSLTFGAFHPISAGLVQAFCARERIHFVLTGHTHDHHLPAPRTVHTMGMELRCGTTLQGAPPNKIPNPPFGNTFLVHSIWHQLPVVVWRSELFQRVVQTRPDGSRVAGTFTQAKSLTFETVVL